MKTLLYPWIVLILFLQASLHGQTLTNQERENQLKKVSAWESFSKNPTADQTADEALSKAALGFIELTHGLSVPERWQAYKQLQEATVQIPDYAKVYRDHLIKLYEDRVKLEADTAADNAAPATLPIATTTNYMAMKSLPTKETVLALADLIEYDKVDPHPGDPAKPAWAVPNIACDILNELPIKNRPYPKMEPDSPELKKAYPAMLAKWKAWARQIKAGKIEPEFGPEVFSDGTSIPTIAERLHWPIPTNATSASTQTSPFHSSWPWMAGGVVIVVSSFAAMRLKKNHGK